MTHGWTALIAIGLAATSLAGCSDDPAVAPATTALTCGAGTTQQGSTCIANATTPPSNLDAGMSTTTPPVDAGPGVVCGAGTVLSGTTCVLAASAQITKARLTYLNLKYDTTKAVLLNNPVSLRFGITASSADNASPAKTAVNVLFSFVEDAPADPKNPKSCSGNGILVNLVGNGIEQQFDADIFPPSSTCSFVTNKTAMHLVVDFDQGLRKSNKPTGIDYPPVELTAANATAGDNKLCRETSDPKAANQGTGCAYALVLAPTPTDGSGAPMVNVHLDKLTPESSVAILGSPKEDSEVPAGQKESNPPAVVVTGIFSLNGRDPYRRKIDPANIPAAYVAAHPTIATDLKFGLTDAQLNALDDLPAPSGGGAPAVVKYDIVPRNKVSPSAWMPLTIDDPKNPDPDGHVTEVDLTELEPGTDNTLSHALYIENTTLAAVTGAGPWANDDEFIVRGCIVANFTEAENTGDLDDSAPVGGDVKDGDCKTFSVVLVKTPVAPGPATAETFAMSWSRQVGDPGLVALIGGLSTNNTLDLSGARTESVAFVDLKGHIGNDFGVRLFNASAKAAALTSTEKSFIDVSVDVFGFNVFGYQNTSLSPSYTNDFKIAKSFDFPVLAYSFGPVSIGITAGVGGNVGISPAFTISAQAGGDTSVPELANATISGVVQGGVTFSGGLTGEVKGGIDLLLASATVAAKVDIIQVSSPVTTTLRWGVTQGTAGAVTQMTVLGNVKWDLTLSWLNATVDAVGTIGLCPFCGSETFNIFKYENPSETFNLLNRSTPVLVLQ